MANINLKDLSEHDKKSWQEIVKRFQPGEGSFDDYSYGSSLTQDDQGVPVFKTGMTTFRGDSKKNDPHHNMLIAKISEQNRNIALNHSAIS